MKTKVFAVTGSLVILVVFLATGVFASGKAVDKPEGATIRNIMLGSSTTYIRLPGLAQPA